MIGTLLYLLVFLISPNQASHEVTVGEFSRFIKDTRHITTSEQLGWSYVAVNNRTFNVVAGANWMRPDGINKIGPEYPVTQISLYDAMAYCEWSGTSLYTIDEWKKMADWSRPNISGQLVPSMSTTSWNGNVWEWTKEGAVIGGSFLCSRNTCAGYTEGKSVHWPGVDASSDNIGFRIKK